ncbi:MAG: D-aminoacyl-tRNA deacylase [Bacteroidota bacterium]
MRALIQRVKEATVIIDGSLHDRIGKGILIFLAVTHTDDVNASAYLARRCSDLRIFEDNDGKMNLSVKDISGEILVISQFTLYADTHKGNRPNFMNAAPPDLAERLYNRFIEDLKGSSQPDAIHSGKFRAMMEVGLINDGPVTIQIDSKEAI